MSEKIILPTNDLCFKKLFSSSQNTDILKGFIQDMFDITAQEVFIKNPYSIKAFNQMLKKKDGFYAVEVDILCVTESNWNFHLEMQLAPQQFYVNRALYYLCSTYQSTYGQDNLMTSKNKYGALYPTFSVNILSFNHFKQDDKAVHMFTLYDEDHKKLSDSDILTLCFFELHKPQIKGTNLKYWQQLFLTGEAEEQGPAYIQKAADLLTLNNFSKGERRMIDTLERATQDRIAREQYVELEGIEKGRAEGIEEARLEDALNMICALRLSVTKTMNVLKMPEGFKEKLISELEKREIPYII